MNKLIIIMIATTLLIGCSKAPDGMVLVEGGEFSYGSSEVSINNVAVTPITKTNLKDFYIDIFEVTNEQYREFIKDTDRREPPTWLLNGFDKTKANHPVTFVKLDDATSYCKWLGKFLPSEPQWERAARGSDDRQYAWGKDFHEGFSNTVTSKIIGTSPVGSFPKGVSPYGVMDLTGNVLEWTNTELADDNSEYITKGGSWGYSHSTSKTFQQFPQDKDSKINNLGFRCVKN